ncbi:TPA: Holliday junction branch migration protein RuvA [Candidatus Gastranaerophilales bacterium HUM_15]|jgi:Holliday junction DNA helicase RuvA|nr:MAG: Holliday junction DNA helicase RuvA [Acinetobacter sp. CAG:196_36_41]CCZ49739.1 holliday junction ATP-dependent DNA helicase RuvA [Acinetobacter sp. CAG:196]DAA98920.1 MAG TPA: Holliday junction branch migration protein RuvA [Candidatus Gastranaerophilales bacterium HUM_8]DAA99296.1 MAG TPA: Holliday junction branch migration protein RuvA [Candidatus Gastranaerophilales bacterium HUM_11]DAB09620.1 MAG TPA: Holliday junction branch migration protein RuvA [Candidatus Gastranaerophilales b
MFDYFKGVISDKRKTSKGTFITIDVSGIGYLLEVTEIDFNCTKVDESEMQKVYVLLTHREDAMSLYGFSNKETRDIFQILLSVSGVGAKMAIALLNEFDACDLISLVIDGNFKELTRAKGVGPKLAQKIILELKDKLMKTELPRTSCKLPKSQAFDDTQAVLLSLGYEENEIEDVLEKIMPTIQDHSNSEEVIRKALTCLSM